MKFWTPSCALPSSIEPREASLVLRHHVSCSEVCWFAAAPWRRRWWWRAAGDGRQLSSGPGRARLAAPSGGRPDSVKRVTSCQPQTRSVSRREGSTRLCSARDTCFQSSVPHQASHQSHSRSVSGRQKCTRLCSRSETCYQPHTRSVIGQHPAPPR